MDPTPAAQDELRLLVRATAVAAGAADLEEAAAAVLEEVCSLCAWPAGHLLLVEPPGGRPAPTTTWHLADPERFRVLRQVTQASANAAARGWVGRAAASGAPVACGPEELPEAAAQAGLCRSFAFPVSAGGAVVAVLVFYAEAAEPPADGRLAVVAGAVEQLGRVAERRRAAAAEEAYRGVLDAANDAFVGLDPAGVVTDWSARAEALFGWGRQEALGRPLSELVIPLRYRVAHDRALRRLRASGGEVAVGPRELTAVNRAGQEFPIELTVWSRGGSSGSGQPAISGFVRDLSERRSFEGQLARQALHDRLTGLPNRVLLRDRLEHALLRSSDGPGSVALVLVDLDRFRAVNDMVGHDGGDSVLSTMAERLGVQVRAGDTLARVGGDQYALLREPSSGPAEVAALAERLLAAVSAPVTVRGSEATVTASVGAALSSGGAEEADLLLRDAELALERAQQRGGGRYEVFDEAVRTEASERLAVESDLRQGIRLGQLRVVYQPIVRLDTGAVVGFEALVRWHHPERGLVPPNDFIPSAEATGLIVPLGRFVLQEACSQAAAWQRHRRDGDEALRVSVNVSTRQLSHPRWSDEVAEALDQSGLEPHQLVLEITESALMEDTDSVVGHLEDLRRVGVRIAVDDFGTGYSSLSYLRRLPVDVLKIDKSFIDGVAEGPHESALARAVIKLAANLRLDAVAEGVSTRRQLAQLRRLRCPYGQGYLFARPQPAEDFADLLALPSLVADGA